MIEPEKKSREHTRWSTKKKTGRLIWGGGGGGHDSPLKTFFDNCTEIPGGGLGIFTGIDLWNIFWVSKFENLYFFGY